MKNKKSIEEMVLVYQRVPSNETFSEIYFETKSEILNDIKLRYFEKKMRIDEGSLLEMFDEAIIYTIGAFKKGQTFAKLVAWKFKALRINYLRDSKRGINRITDRIATDEEGAELDFQSDYELENEVIRKNTAKRKADQRQLIDFLVSGENERTTAIVQTYLSTDLKTPTAIGKHLGLDHKQVTRALTRLASKFSTKQFGNYHDYLVAL